MREEPDTKKKKKPAGGSSGKGTRKSAAKPARDEFPDEKPSRGRKKKELPLPPVYEPDMLSRTAGAIVCIALLVMVLLGIVQPGGAVPDFICRLLRGLTGNGFWLTAPAFLLAAYFLGFCRHRPVWGRMVSLILLPVLFGAFVHVVVVLPGLYPMGTGSLKQLWLDGQQFQSGGLLGGFLGVSFTAWFGRGGGAAILFLLCLLLLAVIFHITPARLMGLKDRLAPYMYEREDDPYEEYGGYPEPRGRDSRRKAEPEYEEEPEEPYDYDLPPVQDHYIPPYRGPRPAEPRSDSVLDKAAAILNGTRRTIFGGTRPDKVADWGESFPDNPEDTIPPAPRRRKAAEPPAEDIPQDTPPVPEDVPPEPDAEEPAYPGGEPDIPEEPAAYIPEREDDRADVFAAYRGENAPPVKRPEPPAAEETVYEEEPFPEQNGEEPILYEEPEPEAPETPVVPQPVRAAQEAQPQEYRRPDASLLTPPTGEMKGAIEEKENTLKRLDTVLASFGIDGHMVGAVQGPSVTRYEMELNQGVRLSKVTNLADDLALALGVASVRVAPVPGKIAIVGIEVPNRVVTPVPIREVIESAAFRRHKSQVAFSVGKDIGGNYIVGDCAKLPHMLIAGTTGSGKSVCINSLLISLLYKSSPEDVRLIMVDPKMVELGIYNGIPHLLIPVVTDPKKAAGALQWSVTEMMRRYTVMSQNGVRKIDEYNDKMAREGGRREPMIVIVIDELADLMMVAAKEVEDSICRVAQMGRAAGIHLVIATQRPSADVITGLMKANIPSRIAFAVASSLESRIILDNTGAEKLVGKGDMLWAPLGSGKPLRVQGCFISDEEVAAVVGMIKESNGEPQYDESVSMQAEQNAAVVGAGKKGGKGGGAPMTISYDPGIIAGDGEELDEMFGAAVDVVIDVGQASVSMLQRRLKLGFARAARVMDQLEEQGIVGPNEGAKSRQVLLTREQWEIKKAGGSIEDTEPVPGTEEPLE